MRTKSSKQLEVLETQGLVETSPKSERGGSFHRATGVFRRRSHNKKKGDADLHNGLGTTECMGPLEAPGLSRIASGVLEEEIEVQSLDRTQSNAENDITVKPMEVNYMSSASDDTLSRKVRDSRTDSLSSKSPNFTRKRNKNIKNAMKRISVNFDKNRKDSASSVVIDSSSLEDFVPAGDLQHTTSNTGSVSSTVNKESRVNPSIAPSNLVESIDSKRKCARRGSNAGARLSHTPTRAVNLIAPSTAASLAMTMTDTKQNEDMPEFTPIWAVADGYKVRATILEAKDLPAWPSGHKPRVSVSVSSNLDGKNYEKKIKTKHVGESSSHGSGSSTVPKWNETVEFDHVRDINDNMTFKVYVTTSAAGVVVDHKIGQISFPVRFVPKVDAVPEDSEIDQIARGPAIVAHEKNNTIDAASLRMVRPDSKTPVKLWLKLTKPGTLPMRLKTKGYKEGWICVVLCLIPAPMDDDSGPNLCGEDEGDAAGLEAPAEIDLPEPYDNIHVVQDFPCSLTKLNRLIFDHDSALVAALQTQRNYTEVTHSPWAPIEEGSNIEKKTNEYIMPASSLVKANRVTETYTRTRPANGVILVDCEVSTPEVPMGDKFKYKLRYTLTKVDDNTSRMATSGYVDYIKSVGMMKKFVDSGANGGTKAAIEELVETIQPYVKKCKRAPKAELAESNSETSMISSVVDGVRTVFTTSIPIPISFIVMMLAAMAYYIAVQQGFGTQVQAIE